MKAWQLPSFGIDNLALLDKPTPGLSANQVLIKVHAVSLNYRDLMVVLGKYNPRMALPRIPCSDGAGEVIAVGEGVSRVKVGQRVAGIFMQNWIDGPPDAAKQRGALGGDIDGMLAEHVVLHENGLIGFPEHLTWEEASALPCAALTAWNALVQVGRVKPGDRVVIQGTGGVSIFALQFAKLLGARVLGTSSSDEKLARASRLGLDAGFNYKRRGDWARWVLEQTNGLGADLMVEVGGAGTLGESLKAVRIGGCIAQIGVLSAGEEPFQIGPVLHKQVHLRGVYVGSRADFEEMNRAIAQHRLQPQIGEVFPFSGVQSALLAMQRASHFSKLVIRVTE
jgi:NADPH:quinone reductase-like Zn-dependent oxidoreductase